GCALRERPVFLVVQYPSALVVARHADPKGGGRAWHARQRCIAAWRTEEALVPCGGADTGPLPRRSLPSHQRGRGPGCPSTRIARREGEGGAELAAQGGGCFRAHPEGTGLREADERGPHRSGEEHAARHRMLAAGEGGRAVQPVRSRVR